MKLQLVTYGRLLRRDRASCEGRGMSTDRARLMRATSALADKLCGEAYEQVRATPHDVEQYPGGPLVIVILSGRTGGAASASISGGDTNDLAGALVSALKATGLVAVVEDSDAVEGSA